MRTTIIPTLVLMTACGDPGAPLPPTPKAHEVAKGYVDGAMDWATAQPRIRDLNTDTVYERVLAHRAISKHVETEIEAGRFDAIQDDIALAKELNIAPPWKGVVSALRDCAKQECQIGAAAANEKLRAAYPDRPELHLLAAELLPTEHLEPRKEALADFTCISPAFRIHTQEVTVVSPGLQKIGEGALYEGGVFSGANQDALTGYARVFSALRKDYQAQGLELGTLPDCE